MTVANEHQIEKKSHTVIIPKQAITFGIQKGRQNTITTEHLLF
jgi:hypothetical protein